MTRMSRTEKEVRNNNVRSREPSITICRLLEQVCWPSRTVIISGTKERENESEKERQATVLLGKFYQFCYFLATVQQRFWTPQAKRLFSCLCASAGFVREIAEHVYNVARISRMLPRHPDECSGLDLYNTKLETRHSRMIRFIRDTWEFFLFLGFFF